MAIEAGDLVTPHRVSAEFTRGYQAQPVRFGICDLVSGLDRSVLWDGGLLQNGIVATALDEVVAPSSTTPMGKVVELDISPNATYEPSGSYDATVVALYRRDLEGSGTLTGDLALVKLLDADVYLEVAVANIRILHNR